MGPGTRGVGTVTANTQEKLSATSACMVYSPCADSS